MAHGPTLGALAAAALSLSTGSPALAAQATAVAQSSPRMMTRVVYFGVKEPAQYSIDYGQPEWRDAYEAQLDGDRDRHLRLGKGFWTVFHSNTDVTIGGVRVPAGIWYLGVLRSAKAAWSLTFMSSSKINAQRLDAGQTARITPDVKVPMRWAALAERQDRLSIELARDEDALGKATLTMRWGKHGLSATVVTAVEPVVIEGAPEFSMPAADELVATESGLRYAIVRAGAGKPPGPTSTVTVHYTGWLSDGTLFDSSRKRGGEPLRLPLQGVIKGWQEGLQLMTPGSVFKLVIPSALGYGGRGAGPIPPNATLVFEVELLGVD